VEVGKAGQLGQVLAAAAPRPHPRPAHQARLRQLLNRRRKNIKNSKLDHHDFPFIPLQYYGYGTRMVRRGSFVDPHKFQCGSGSSILGLCGSGSGSGSGSDQFLMTNNNKNFTINCYLFLSKPLQRTSKLQKKPPAL
jgi:hypothetical protein